MNVFFQQFLIVRKNYDVYKYSMFRWVSMIIFSWVSMIMFSWVSMIIFSWVSMSTSSWVSMIMFS